ncbi:MAG: polyprenol monophosphomannose synthase [Pseudomonadota bacterium]|nr:polyprenol monophosphomannose synthase [Pseudomonadota bacterium]
MDNQNLVIIPTYNERDNIKPLVQRVFEYPVHLLCVDDRGSDDTAAEIARQQRKYPNLHLLQNPQRGGLGRAYVLGMQWGLDKGYQHLITMDADLSHDPKYLPTILAALQSNDVVIGSRYVASGDVSKFNLLRQMLSRFSSWYARTLLDLPIKDITSGFVGFRKNILEKINLAVIDSRGFIFQVETKLLASLHGGRVKEIPIAFGDRLHGASKMSAAIIFEAMFATWALRKRKQIMQATNTVQERK